MLIKENENIKGNVDESTNKKAYKALFKGRKNRKLVKEIKRLGKAGD